MGRKIQAEDYLENKQSIDAETEEYGLGETTPVDWNYQFVPTQKGSMGNLKKTIKTLQEKFDLEEVEC